MAKPGSRRPLKSQARRQLEGAEARRPEHRRPEAAFPLGADPPPTCVGAALAYWDYYAPFLTRAGVLTAGDRDILARYCHALAEHDAIREVQQAAGYRRVFVRTTKDGGEVVSGNPLDGQLRGWVAVIRALAVELGLTPASRARAATVSREAGEDPLETFLRRVP